MKERFKQWLNQPPHRARIIDLLVLIALMNFFVSMALISVTLFAQQNAHEWAEMRTIEIVRQADPPDVIYVYPAPQSYPAPTVTR